MTIASSGTEYSRPVTSGALSAWLGQRTAATAGSDSMLIPASVEDVRTHIQSAVELTHPLHKHGSRLPPDVQDAVRWVVQRGTSVAAERTTRLQQLVDIQSSLEKWDRYLCGEKECLSTSGP